MDKYLKFVAGWNSGISSELYVLFVRTAMNRFLDYVVTLLLRQK